MSTVAMAIPMSGEVTDSELVARVLAGERAAFAQLHQRYCRMVHAILLARVSPSHADDLVQDVFLLVLEKLPSLRSPERFGAWLAQITRNRATDHHRRTHDIVELPTTLSRPPRPSAEVAQVLAALTALPEAYQETLIMRLVEGMTGPEIARRTGMKPGSVRVNLHRGMALLRERLGVEKKP